MSRFKVGHSQAMWVSLIPGSVVVPWGKGVELGASGAPDRSEG
jgi:hypothetical protein